MGLANYMQLNPIPAPSLHPNKNAHIMSIKFVRYHFLNKENPFLPWKPIPWGFTIHLGYSPAKMSCIPIDISHCVIAAFQ